MIGLLDRLLGGPRPLCTTKGCGRKMVPLRRGVPIFVCTCGGMRFGRHTVSLDPANLVKWSTSGVPVALGDIGMDTATGRMQQFVGGSVQAVANLADVVSSRTYVFTSPDTLTTTDNALIPWLPGGGTQISELLGLVKTAPTGADLIIEFFRGTRATGTVGASLGTVTIPAGSFTASTAITPTTIALTEFVAMTINQIGLTIAGSDLTGIVR